VAKKNRKRKAPPAPKKSNKTNTVMAISLVALLVVAVAAYVLNASQTSSPTSSVAQSSPPPLPPVPTPSAIAQTTPSPIPSSSASPAGKPGKEITTASGLKYIDEVIGTGKSPSPRTMVTVHYVGTLQNGTKFDSSYDHPGAQPYQFQIGAGTVIKGWDEGLMTMKEGGKRKLIVPPDLAYGAAGRPGIPPNSTLIFEVQLVKVG
jgi:peptidylprolyl isomerase